MQVMQLEWTNNSQMWKQNGIFTRILEVFHNVIFQFENWMFENKMFVQFLEELDQE
jgi:hypothetical protein